MVLGLCRHALASEGGPATILLDTRQFINIPVIDKAHDARFALRLKVCLQGVQRQLNQANVEHAAVMSQLRALHSAALEEVRCLQQQQSRI